MKIELSSSLHSPNSHQYLVMHSRQSILYREPKIYNDVPMEIKLLNNPESFKYKSKNIIAAICITYLTLYCTNSSFFL